LYYLFDVVAKVEHKTYKKLYISNESNTKAYRLGRIGRKNEVIFFCMSWKKSRNQEATKAG